MKYVILDRMGLEIPVIFTELENHTDHVQPYQTVIAAGFCRFYVDQDGLQNVHCWGQSVGLKLSSRIRTDEEIILRQNEFSS